MNSIVNQGSTVDIPRGLNWELVFDDERTLRDNNTSISDLQFTSLDTDIFSDYNLFMFTISGSVNSRNAGCTVCFSSSVASSCQCYIHSGGNANINTSFILRKIQFGTQVALIDKNCWSGNLAPVSSDYLNYRFLLDDFTRIYFGANNTMTSLNATIRYRIYGLSIPS